MSKPFFEVFPSLKLHNPLRDMMEQTEVDRVAATRSREYLRIYVSGRRLILKQDIRAVEQEILTQLFPGSGLNVRIYEHFTLSSQYNPEKLMSVYRESILLELQEYNHILYNAFKNAELVYPDEHTVLLRMDDTVLVRGKEEELLRILEKILVERCGFSVSVKAEYREVETGRYEQEDALRLKLRVKEIAERGDRGGERVFCRRGRAAEAAENGERYGPAGTVLKGGIRSCPEGRGCAGKQSFRLREGTPPQQQSRCGLRAGF